MDPMTASTIAFVSLRLILDLVDGIQGARENLDEWSATILEARTRGGVTMEDVLPFLQRALASADESQVANDRLKAAAAANRALDV